MNSLKFRPLLLARILRIIATWAFDYFMGRRTNKLTRESDVKTDEDKNNDISPIND